MTILVEHEHLYGNRAVKIGKILYPVASPVSDYIAALEKSVDNLTNQVEEYQNGIKEADYTEQTQADETRC